MKNSVLKLVAVIAAFLIGVSINNSCGEPGVEETPSAQELWNIVRQLQSEVEELKATGGGNQGEGNEVLIDGLYFDRNGQASSKIKRYYTDSYSVEYTYDNNGRIQSYTSTSNGSTSSTTYVYSDKTVINTTKTIYDPNIYPSMQNTTTVLTNEYY